MNSEDKKPNMTPIEPTVENGYGICSGSDCVWFDRDFFRCKKSLYETNYGFSCIPWFRNEVRILRDEVRKLKGE